MRDVNREPTCPLDRIHQRPRLVKRDIPGLTTVDAMEMAVDGQRLDVELLSAVDPVAVTDQAQGLEDIERAIDRRRGRGRVHLATALDQLGAGHMAIGRGEDVDEGPSLGCPAQSVLVQPVAHGRPGDGLPLR